jgi:uncharacterized protein (TIGR01777 family)
MKIVIPGGSGRIGQVLARHFHQRGEQVTVLSRTPSTAPWEMVAWNGRDPGDWIDAIDGADVVINLAGRSVDCRYSPANRKEIMASRVQSTHAIGVAIAQAARPPALWLNASTATIYRHSLDRPMDEATGEIGGGGRGEPATWKFSIDVATAWERAFFEAAMPRTRKVAMRSAIVTIASRDGWFGKLMNLVRFGLGGSAGPGTQYMSWIHEADFIRAVEFLMAREGLDGCVNLCSPNPLPNRDFMRALRTAYGTPFGPPLAGWMLKIGTVLLRTEAELVLKSRRVVPRRLLEAGFEFVRPRWEDAAQDLVHRWRMIPAG